MTILADTSVWIDALRTGGTALPGMTADDIPIGYTPPVLMELLSGCRTEQEADRVWRIVARGPLLAFDPIADFEGSAAIYRAACRRGMTPSSHVDCMIIAVALRSAATLVTLDRKQAAIAEIFGVEVG